MTSSYDNDLRLNEQGTGDNSGSWGTVTNLNLEMIAEAFSYGTRVIADAPSDNITLTDGALDADRSMYLRLSGGGQACTVTFLPATISKVWLIENATSATLTMKQGSSPAGIAIPAGQVKMIATDGGGSTNGVVYDLLTDVNLAGTTVMSAATIDDVAIDGKVITMTGSSGDTATLTVAADGALAIATTDAAAAAANISITADGTFTATGTTITLDSAGDIILDADGADVIFKDGGTSIGTITNASSDLVIKSNVQDKDILLKGDDGGTEITALSLDMSAGGNALFSGTVTRDLTRGSIDVGNSSGLSTPLAKGSAGTVLTSDGTDISWAAAGGGADIQTFTSSGTWTKPSSGTMCFIYAASGAGGGGVVNSVTNKTGGIGSFLKMKGILASNMPSSASITIGAGGSGSTSSGAAGSNGGVTSVGTVFHVAGGTGGASYNGTNHYASASALTATQAANNVANAISSGSNNNDDRAIGGRGGNTTADGTYGALGKGGDGQGGDGTGFSAGGACSLDSAGNGGDGTGGIVTIITF